MGVDVLDEGYNLADDATCEFGATGDRVVADARLAPLGDNGGPTRTHALLAGSPAIDGGDPSRCLPRDQRLIDRPGGACDIGAFEGNFPRRAEAAISRRRRRRPAAIRRSCRRRGGRERQRRGRSAAR